MLTPMVPVWKQAPFIRLLIPLMLGITTQWYRPFSLTTIAVTTFIFFFIFVLAKFLKGYFLYLHKWLLGFMLMAITMLFGAGITHVKNITHQHNWFGHSYTDSTSVIAVLSEPLVEKNKSYKANATIYGLIAGERIRHTKGSVIIYFKKDSNLLAPLHYGSAIIFKKPLQPIKNSGNPGAFDYKRYCLFQGITHQVYLKENDFAMSSAYATPTFPSLLQYFRKRILQILKKFIPGQQEAAIAEALLVGYRNDLDRDLLQLYANTGVIHVIAISGMHLAMIYGLLTLLLMPLQRNAKTKWLRGVIILCVLWLFTLLAGAGPSILRSCIMFSFIIIGESLRRKVSVYHTLSASAFFLLCWNPFLLWDVGFQLSYAAVLSIVIFLRPVTGWFYSKNRIANYTWKLMAVTLSAQVLTTPLSIYHFHQVPNLFLLSNLVIVPLSGFILYGAILLCFLSPFTAGAMLTGKILSALLRFMNNFIAFVDSIPFAVSNNIHVSFLQTLLLYVFIVAIAVWLLQPKRQMLPYALLAILGFVCCRSADLVQKQKQHKLIVYNVPKYSAIDYINGTQYRYTGDSAVEADSFMRNFHLTPARHSLRAAPCDSLKNIQSASPFVYFYNKRILLLDTIPQPLSAAKPLDVDIIILSKNVNVRISSLQKLFQCPQYIFDASNTAWKIREWKNDCDSLHLRRHSIPDDGAFVLDF